MNLKIRKKLLSLVLAGSLALVPTSSLMDMEAKNDIVVATSKVNIRLGDNIKSTRLGSIPKGEKAERILALDNNWDIVRYKNHLGYVSRDYLDVCESNEIEIPHYENHDILYTTSKVNFRVGPGKEYDRITSIPKDYELKSIAITDNNWYLVTYNNQIGYVSGDYLVSTRQVIGESFPDAIDPSSVTVEKMGYAKKNTNIYNGDYLDSIVIDRLDKYESMSILLENNDYYFVQADSRFGFVRKEDINVLQGMFIIIDVSEQKLVLFEDNEAFVTTNIVTGKDKSPTPLGFYKVYSKETNRYLKGDGYNSFVKYWMPFNGGIGLHDASWRSKFGGTTYHKNGSHGCVNMPSEVTEEIFDLVDVGTKVLVHK